MRGSRPTSPVSSSHQAKTRLTVVFVSSLTSSPASPLSMSHVLVAGIPISSLGQDPLRQFPRLILRPGSASLVSLSHLLSAKTRFAGVPVSSLGQDPLHRCPSVISSLGQDPLRRRGRPQERQDRDLRAYRVPQGQGEVHAPRRQDPEGSAARRAARRGKDAAR